VTTSLKVKKLGDVCDFIGGSQPPKSEFIYDLTNLNKNDYSRLIQIRDYKSDKHIIYIQTSKTKKFCEKDDVMIGRYGPPVFQILKGLEGAYNVALMKAVPSNESLNKEYLFKFLESPDVQQYIIGLSERAAGQTGVNKRALNDYPIPIPSIKDQKRIVAILDQAFAEIEKARANAEQNLKNARELFEGYLQQVFSQRGECFKQVALSEMTECISDGDHSAPPKSPKGIPFITISNIDKSTNIIDFSNTFKVPEEYYVALKETRKPQVGDVLYTVTGSYGIPVMVRDKKRFCFQRHIGLIRPNKEVDSQWLYYLLMSPQVFNQADRGATGTAQKTVSLTLLRNILVPNIPLDVQREMAGSVDIMYKQSKKLENTCSIKIESLNELKKSILQKAFTGELTKETAT